MFYDIIIIFQYQTPKLHLHVKITKKVSTFAVYLTINSHFVDIEISLPIANIFRSYFKVYYLIVLWAMPNRDVPGTIMLLSLLM